MRHRVHRFRRAVTLAASIAIALLVTPAIAAGAAATTTTTAAPGSVPRYDVLNGITVGPATVTAAGQPGRHLDADQFTAFMQTWLPDSIVSKIPNVPRPKGLQIWTLDSTTTWSGTTVPFKALYATDGTTVYVGMPAESLGWASVTTEKWIVSPSPQDTVKAFDGKLAPGGPQNVVTTPSTGSSGTTTTVAGQAAGHDSGGSSGGSDWLLYAIPAVIVLGVGGLFVMRNRAARAG